MSPRLFRKNRWMRQRSDYGSGYRVNMQQFLNITALRWIYDSNAFINSSHKVAMVRVSGRRVWAETRTLTDREV